MNRKLGTRSDILQEKMDTLHESMQGKGKFYDCKKLSGYDHVPEPSPKKKKGLRRWMQWLKNYLSGIKDAILNRAYYDE